VADFPSESAKIMPECVDSFLTTAGMLHSRVPEGVPPSATYAGEAYVCGEIEGVEPRVCGLVGNLNCDTDQPAIRAGSCLVRVLHEGMPILED